MSLSSVTERLNALGFRKSTVTKSYTGYDIIDFYKNNKCLDMYSVFVNGDGLVEYVEMTKIKWNEKEKRNIPETTKLYSMGQLPLAR